MPVAGPAQAKERSSRMRFERKVAVIVGAAHGIAAACARIMAAEGGTVVGIDRDTRALASTMDEIMRSRDAAGLAIPADALDPNDVVRAVDQVMNTFGRIDILVNAVGGSTVIENMNAKLEDLTLPEWQSLIDFNLLPTFLFCKAVIPTMKKQRSGKIVNISSHAAYGIEAASSAYATSKAGVNGLTRKLAVELGPFGINCNAIAPSRTATDRVLTMMETTVNTATEQYLERIPLRRLATPEEQASVICFLASSDADYVTGVTINVTGGQ